MRGLGLGRPVVAVRSLPAPPLPLCRAARRNPIYSPSGPAFSAPSTASVDAFQATVQRYGLPCTVRQTKGEDIAGACGQLVLGARGGGDCGLAGAAERGGGAAPAGGRGLPDIEELAGAA